MFNTFEIKSYPQLQFALGAVNFMILSFLCIVSYFFVITPSHVKIINDILDFLSKNKILSLIPVGILVVIWGWISTHFLRLHDRICEPYLFRWRAIYDADFILRALLYDISGSISCDIYERAYVDKRICEKLMQRLFYNFVGDETTTAQGRRLFFYTVMWKYWSLALLDLYAVVFLLFLSAYHIVTKSSPNPVVLGIIIMLSLITRITSKRSLDEAHKITIEQIASIKKEHAEELRKEALSVATELGF